MTGVSHVKTPQDLLRPTSKTTEVTGLNSYLQWVNYKMQTFYWAVFNLLILESRTIENSFNSISILQESCCIYKKSQPHIKLSKKKIKYSKQFYPNCSSTEFLKYFHATKTDIHTSEN